ncbi:MAG: hypothetical protein ACN6OV_13460 [Acinetobacter sp.]
MTGNVILFREMPNGILYQTEWIDKKTAAILFASDKLPEWD